MINLYGISGILTGITGLSMAILVYIKGYKHKLARAWSAFAISVAWYGFGSYYVTLAKDASDGFFRWQIAYIGIILIPFLFVRVVYEFLNIKRPVFINTIGILAVFLLYSDIFLKKLFINNATLYFRDITWAKPIYFAYPPGPFLKFFIIFFFFGLVIYAHFELIKNYNKISALKRSQTWYFFFAATMGFIGGGASFLPCFGISFYPIFNFAIPIYFFIMSYAILRYRLMDISVTITRTTIFIVLYTLILGLPFVLANSGRLWMRELLGENWWAGPLILMAGSATIGPFIYIYLQRRAEAILLREQKQYQKTLKQAAKEMARIRNLKKLLNLIVQIITQTVRISYSAIYLFDTKSKEFILQAECNVKAGQTPSIRIDNAIIMWLKKNRELLVYEEIRQKTNTDSKPLVDDLETQMRLLDAAVIVPSFLEDKLLSFLVLGDKLSGKLYTSEDLDVFSVLADQAALAIENALLYGNIEEQVRQRSKELVEVQKQLVQAEKLATVGTLAGGVAHEINNPLAAILTSVQMLLTSDSINDESDKDSLQLIEEATQRCRDIVKKLMFYARKPLESQEMDKVDLQDVIKNVVSFVGYQLQQENIEVHTKADNKVKYTVKGNQNELEHVLTNIVLNARDAIEKAKKSGTIYISLTKTREHIELAIKDEGEGMPAEVKAKIFDPFFTTKEVGKGLGLGLSICQAIMERHKGVIKVKSELNKGSVFTIQLPQVLHKKTNGQKVLSDN